MLNFLLTIFKCYLLFATVDGFKLINYQYKLLRQYPDPPCSSEIFCHGRLIHAVQMAQMFNDSKTFVDMKLKASPEQTLVLYDQFVAQHAPNGPSKEALKIWVNENFEDVGSEFENWTPDDWKENPTFLDGIADVALREWASDLNRIWLDLGRKMKKEVGEHIDLYSIIHVDNPVIVPGGRFREFYYWDSYWIVRGLLLSEMFTTVKGMLENFFSIIDRFGFIPNGGRIYYSMRSQPPLLAGMVKSYVDTTGDYEFAKTAVETLVREHEFWMNNHVVEIKNHKLALYGDKSNGPRPESYREDIISASIFNTDEEKEEHFSELKAAAESGMDFSSRWFIKNGKNDGDLTDLKTRSIIPVELNAILYWNTKIIAEFYKISGNLEKEAEYIQKSQDIYQAVQAVLWHDDVGAWLDYDLINDKRREYFTPTNLSPLWLGCYNHSDSANIAEKVLAYIEKNRLDDFPGGVPNTLNPSGEQWDFPNVWPPMQYLLVWGLDSLDDKRTKDLAYKWAQRWITSNFLAYKETQSMYEKYNAEEVGGHGGGGEYGVQLGFGWSNGVVLDFLNKYGQQMKSGGVTNMKTNAFFTGMVLLTSLVRWIMA